MAIVTSVCGAIFILILTVSASSQAGELNAFLVVMWIYCIAHLIGVAVASWFFYIVLTTMDSLAPLPYPYPL